MKGLSARNITFIFYISQLSLLNEQGLYAEIKEMLSKYVISLIALEVLSRAHRWALMAKGEAGSEMPRPTLSSSTRRTRARLGSAWQMASLC